MNPLPLLSPLLFLAILALLLFGIPLWLLIRRGGRVRRIIGGVWLVASIGFVSLFFIDHTRVLGQGTTPDGREWCLTFTSDPRPAFENNVQLWVRNKDGTWVWAYVEHEAWPWELRRGATLEVSNGVARVMYNGKPYRKVDLPSPDDVPVFSDKDVKQNTDGYVYPINVHGDFAPSNTTPEDLAKRRPGFPVKDGAVVLP